jgi:uncharacterized membrane protein
LGAGTTPALAQYRFETFAGPSGGSQIYEEINKHGDIVSEVTTAAGVSSCNLLKGTATTPIADAKGSYTQCYGLDTSDEVVGFYVPTANQNTLVGFTYVGGTYTDFLAKHSDAAEGGTQLNAISANGKIIVGTYSNKDGYSIAFTLVGGKQTDIAIAGADYLVATGVDNAGDVAVQSFDVNNNILANYLISKGAVTAISFPGAPKTTVHAINDDGTLVGNFTNSAGIEEGFTYDIASGTYSAAVDDAKVTDTILIGINDNGDIVGGAVTKKGALIGLVALPGG